MRADEIAIMQAEARRIGAELLLPTPRAILNAESGRFAYACPDLDQEFSELDYTIWRATIDAAPVAE